VSGLLPEPAVCAELLAQLKAGVWASPVRVARAAKTTCRGVTEISSVVGVSAAVGAGRASGRLLERAIRPSQDDNEDPKAAFAGTFWAGGPGKSPMPAGSALRG